MNYVRNSIQWCDYTWNVVKGLCPMQTCPYCYSKAIYRRFKLDPKIRFDEKELLAPQKLKKSSRIFCGSTIEIYHPQIPYDWISAIIAVSWNAPQHTFLTLTKLPANLESIEFPRWWWIGATVTLNQRPDIVLRKLIDIRGNVKFISFEPLLGDAGHYINLQGIDWIILGGQSGPNKLYPQEDWIQRLEDKADELNIPVFEKKNLRKVWDRLPRQEFP